MTAVILYESEFGATRAIAEAIATGMREVTPVALEDARDLFHPLATSVDVLLVGAPTHARGLPTAASRAEAQKWPAKPGSTLKLEPHVDLPGVKEWLASQNLLDVNAVAFATRMDMARAITGSATRAIERGLRHAGATIGSPAETFIVDKTGNLVDGERERATVWGRGLATSLARALAGRVTPVGHA